MYLQTVDSVQQTGSGFEFRDIVIQTDLLEIVMKTLFISAVSLTFLVGTAAADPTAPKSVTIDKSNPSTIGLNNTPTSLEHRAQVLTDDEMGKIVGGLIGRKAGSVEGFSATLFAKGGSTNVRIEATGKPVIAAPGY